MSLPENTERRGGDSQLGTRQERFVSRQEMLAPQTGWFSFIPLSDGHVVMPQGLRIATGMTGRRQSFRLEPAPENIARAHSEKWLQEHTPWSEEKRKRMLRKVQDAHTDIFLAEQHIRLLNTLGDYKKDKAYPVNYQEDIDHLERLRERERKLLGRVIYGSQIEEPMRREVGWVMRKAGITQADMDERRQIVRELYNTIGPGRLIADALEREGVRVEEELSAKARGEIAKARKSFGQQIKEQLRKDKRLKRFERKRKAFMRFAQGTYKVSAINPQFYYDTVGRPTLLFEEARGIGYQYYKNRLFNDPNNPELAYRYAFPLAACIGYVTADSDPQFLLQWRAGAGSFLLERINRLERLIEQGSTADVQAERDSIARELEKMAVNKIYGDVLGPPGGIMDSKKHRRKHGAVRPLNNKSAQAHAEWEIKWEVGLTPDQTVELMPVAALIDQREFHSELAYYGKSKLTFQEIFENAISETVQGRRNPNYAHEFAERTTGIAANPETIERLITRVDSPLPTTHVGVVEALGHKLRYDQLVERGFSREEALRLADEWLLETDTLARDHYVIYENVSFPGYCTIS